MGTPVITTAAGGIPVIDVTSVAPRLGMPVTEAANGYGTRITKSTNGYGMPVVFDLIGVAAPFAATALDPATVYETTLTTSNLTATRTVFSGSIYGGAHSIAYKTAGKYYWEAIVGTPLIGSPGWAIGLMSSTCTYQNFASDGTNCFSVTNGRQIYSNNVLAGAVGGLAVVAGDLFGIAIDLGARLGWARRGAAGIWNNSGAANPATGVGGITIGAGSFAPGIGFASSSLNNSWVSNFGGSAFVGVVPSGFTPGWTV